MAKGARQAVWRKFCDGFMCEVVEDLLAKYNEKVLWENV